MWEFLSDRLVGSRITAFVHAQRPALPVAMMLYTADD